MIQIVLMSLVWAVASTCLIRFWFWKGILTKNGSIYNDREDKKIGFSYFNKEKEFKTQIGCFFATLLISVFVYSILAYPINLYGSLPMIMICLLIQCLWDYQNKALTSLLIILTIFSGYLLAEDSMATQRMKIPAISEKRAEVKFVIGNGLEGMVVETDSKDKIRNFIPCSHMYNDIVHIRDKYPTQKLITMFITVSDNKPYRIYALADRDCFFGEYTVYAYAKLNMQTGSIEEIKL